MTYKTMEVTYKIIMEWAEERAKGFTKLIYTCDQLRDKFKDELIAAAIMWEHEGFKRTIDKEAKQDDKR